MRYDRYLVQALLIDLLKLNFHDEYRDHYEDASNDILDGLENAGYIELEN